MCNHCKSVTYTDSNMFYKTSNTQLIVFIETLPLIVVYVVLFVSYQMLCKEPLSQNVCGIQALMNFPKAPQQFVISVIATYI